MVAGPNGSNGTAPATAVAKAAARQAAGTLEEIGTSGLKVWAGQVADEFLRDLRGRRGIATYREMADNDAVVGSVLFAIEMVLRKVGWHVEPYDGGETDPSNEDDLANAIFLESCLKDMSFTWADTLATIFTFLPYGWAFLELCYKYRDGEQSEAPGSPPSSAFDDGRIGWRKWALRNHETLREWKFDDDGGVQAFVQQDPVEARERPPIPIQKALLFRTSTARGNPEGRSILRNAYRTWVLKRRIEEIEAIGIERDLAGLPVIYAPEVLFRPSATADEKAVYAELQRIVTTIKRDEQEGVLMPMVVDEKGNKMYELVLLSTGGSRAIDIDATLSRYDQRIAMTVLADFILLGHEKVGSKAIGASKMDFFTAALEAWVNSTGATINRHAVPRLWRLNGLDPKRPALLVADEIEAIDLAVLVDVILKLAQSGAPIWTGDPEDPSLRWFYDHMNVPPPGVDQSKEVE